MTIKSEIAKQSSSTKSIHQWLESPNADYSIRHAHVLLRMEKDWQHALHVTGASAARNIANQSRIAGLANGELTVLVQTAAARAKVNLLAPALAESLRVRGWQLSRIRVQVQELAIRQHMSPTPIKRQIGAESARTIAASVTTIRHASLRNALERLAALGSQSDGD